MAADAIEVRPAEDADRRALAELFAAVAEERDGIAAEPPVDVEARAASWQLEGTLVAVAGGEIVGSLFVHRTSFGFGELGMMVAPGWRGRGVGTALVAASIDWGARGGAAQAVAQRLPPQRGGARPVPEVRGFVEEGRRVKHMRRASGELWDLIEMGLLL